MTRLAKPTRTFTVSDVPVALVPRVSPSRSSRTRATRRCSRRSSRVSRWPSPSFQSRSSRLRTVRRIPATLFKASNALTHSSHSERVSCSREKDSSSTPPWLSLRARTGMIPFAFAQFVLVKTTSDRWPILQERVCAARSESSSLEVGLFPRARRRRDGRAPAQSSFCERASHGKRAKESIDAHVDALVLGRRRA